MSSDISVWIWCGRKLSISIYERSKQFGKWEADAIPLCYELADWGWVLVQTFENAQWRHIKPVLQKHLEETFEKCTVEKALWGDTLKRTEEKKANEKGTHYHSGIALLADWGAVLVETLENAQWRNIKQMQPLKTPWGEILSCIVEKALWGDIWKVK